VTESGRSPRRRELVEPGPMRRDREAAPASMRRDMEPPASRCWWMAMASAWRCRSSSSAGVSLGPPRADRALPIRLLRDTAAAARCSLRGMHANALPIGKAKSETGKRVWEAAKLPREIQARQEPRIVDWRARAKKPREKGGILSRNRAVLQEHASLSTVSGGLRGKEKSKQRDSTRNPRGERI